ncbi:PLAT domain-containing protein 1-like [Abeliophyllum distichum]|uniref:PLAT domain-containing protein 1-like n=1 Tax=Abeliophyllum distichum TaxID=126358 RepID=A0ABD1Q6R2_9LAMI
MIYLKSTTEPKKSVASPAQTVADKDFLNPLMAVDLPKVQQTQGTVDFHTNQAQQNSSGQTDIWDTLGEPSGKFDYLVKYSSSVEQDSPESTKKNDNQCLDKGKEILQDSQDPEDDIICINQLLSRIERLKDSPEKSKKLQKRKKKIVKKKREDVSDRFEQAITKALDRVFSKKEESKEREIKECPEIPENSQADDDEFGEDEHLGTNNSDSGMSFSPTAQHNLDT